MRMMRIFQKSLSVVMFMSQALIMDTQLAACYQTSPPERSRLTLVRGVWEKSEKPSNRYSWSSYSITVGLSVWNTNAGVMISIHG